MGQMVLSRATGAFGVGVWKNIREGWNSFSRFTRFVVGMVSRSVFGIALVKDANVADNLEFLGNFNQWNVSFTREVDNFVSFF